MLSEDTAFGALLHSRRKGPAMGSWYRRSVQDRIRGALLVLAAALAQSSCSSDSCTEMGCSSLVTIAGELPPPSGTVTVKACRNQACSTLSDAAPEGCRSVNSMPTLQVCFTTGATLRIDVAIYHDSSSPAPANGDLYTLEVRDGAGATLVDFSGSATYSEYRPNGEGCEPVCKSAALEL
jgi:hypothetical protein